MEMGMYIDLFVVNFERELNFDISLFVGTSVKHIRLQYNDTIIQHKIITIRSNLGVEKKGFKLIRLESIKFFFFYWNFSGTLYQLKLSLLCLALTEN